MPFRTLDDAGFPIPVIAQLDKKHFEICVPFKYRQREETPWVTVPRAECFRRTDLASVPGFLLWLVPRYGVHTLAALLHDQLVKDPQSGARKEADTIFRNALGELEVPWIRRWMMWAGVSLGTMWDSSLLGKLRLGGWFIGVALATIHFWEQALAAFTDFNPWLLAPIFGHGMVFNLAIAAALSLVFVPRIGLGWLAAVTMIFIFVPTVAVLIFTGIYLFLEWIGRGLLALYSSAILFGQSRKVSARLGLEPVDNVPVIMTLSNQTGADQPRGCPEVQVDRSIPTSKEGLPD
jgi:Protein of unknown function (DUF1353)